MELASAYFGRGQMTTALDQVKLAIAADPLYGEAFNLRGLIYTTSASSGLAEESFKRALQLNARDADAMHNYGWYLCQQKRYRGIERAVHPGAREPQYRGVARTLLAQGVCQAYAGQLAEAEARCRAPTSSTRPARSRRPTSRKCCTGAASTSARASTCAA